MTSGSGSRCSELDGHLVLESQRAGSWRKLGPPAYRRYSLPLMIRPFVGWSSRLKAMPRCPVCDSWVTWFRPHGNPLRRRARCPRCGSLERHRLIARYLDQQDFFNGLGRLLDIGPWPPLTRFAGRHAIETVTLDLHAADVDVRAPIEELPFDDGGFDTVLCVHVLEHVEDDHAGLREIRRVLRHSGRAILQVPLLAEDGPTDEDPSVTDPAERQARFGQHDHVRAYGRDFSGRVAAAGFVVDEVQTAAIASDRERRRFGLPSDVLYVAT